MTKINLRDLEQTALAATPGPWSAVSDLPMYAVWSEPAQRDVVCTERRSWANKSFAPMLIEDDAKFIASMNPQTALALIKVVKAAKKYWAQYAIEEATREGIETAEAALEEALNEIGEQT